MDALDRLLTRHFQRAAPSKRGIFCPSERDIDQYASGMFSQEQTQAIESHLHICPYCQEEVAFLKTETPPIFGEVSEDARARIGKLLSTSSMPSPTRSIASIIVELAKDMLRVIETTGTILSQNLAIPEPAVRGDQQQEPAARVQHITGPYTVTVALHPFIRTTVLIEIVVRGAHNGEPISGLSVRLSGEGKDQRKTTDMLGRVSFARVPVGQHQMRCGQDETVSQPIELEIRPAHS